jgi:D-arabinose 1-dehydrogenase-like Zn-dependent alcohol dehydrogenase
MLAKGGRLVSVGLFGGSAQVPLPILAQRGIEIVGNYTGTLADLSELMGLVRKGTISPVVSEVLRLEDVNLALDRLRGGDVQGRILVSPS